MKILFVCHRLPFPPARGGKIRPFNIIKHFHQQGHEVTVASLARTTAELEEGRGLDRYCARSFIELVTSPAAAVRMLGQLFTLSPSSMGYFYSPRLRRTIRGLLDREAFDLIIVHCSSVAQYVGHVSGVPKLLDLGDLDSQKWLMYARRRLSPLAPGYWLEGRKLARAEKRLAERFTLCSFTTHSELADFKHFQTGTPCDWFPNGVDSEYFAPTSEPFDSNTISFIGRMDYYPNQEAAIRFCSDVLPRLRARRHDVRLFVVGASPSQAIRRLSRLPGVTVTGSVSDVRPYVLRSALTVAPLSLARGTQNKILESLAMGVPVVASPQAAKGVDAVAGEHLLVADEPEDWCEAIVGLLDDSARRERFARAGRARMLSNHNWAKSMERLDRIVHSCLALHAEASRSTARMP